MIFEHRVIFEKDINFEEVVQFALIANTFENEIKLKYDNTEVNGKGVLGLMKLLLDKKNGDTITLMIEGAGSEQILQELLSTVEPLGEVI